MTELKKEFARKYDPVKKGRGEAGDVVAGREFLTGAQMASCSQVRASALSPAYSVMLLKGTLSLREGGLPPLLVLPLLAF